ncbi:zinc finger, CCHC-type containing protein [Tanacetum coccineum]
MVAAAMKPMASSFAKLEKFKGVDFRRWQKKMHFMLSSMSVVYVLTAPMPEDGGENPTVEQVRKRAKWDNDNYVCRGLILNGMSDSLFDVYQNVETSKELWDTLEAKYMAEDASSKKFLVSNFTNYKMTDSRPVLEQYNELLGILGRFTQHNMNMDESIKEELTLIELGSHLCIEKSPKAQDNDKLKGNNVVGPSVVNMVEYNNSSRYNDNKGKRKHHDTRANPNKKPKVICWKCGKPGHLKKDCKGGNIGNRANGSSTKGSEDGSSNPLKDDGSRESLNEGSILHMGNESTTLVHRRSCVDLRLNIVSDNIGSAFMSTSKLNDSILWHARLGHVHFKRMQDMSKDGLIPAFDMDTEKCQTCMLNKITKKPFQNVKRETEVLELIHSDLCDLHATPSLGNKKYFVTFIDDASRFCYVYLLHSKDEALDKFKVFKTKVELQQGSLIKRFRTDREGEYMDTLYFQSVGMIHETTAPYTPQQNGISERKNRVLKEMVNSMLSYSGLSQGFWGEAMAVVRLPDPKLKTLGERGIKCIFVGYAEHFKAFRFYVIEPNDSVAINSIIESRDAIFDEHRFSSDPRPSQRSLGKGTDGSGGSVVSERVTDEIVQQSEPRKSKRHRTPKDFGPEFQLYLVEGTRDEVSDQHSYCFNVEDDPKIFDEAMKSQDVAFWKEAINDEMDSIMGNNTWVLTDLPPGCRPLGCKWIFKRKLKVDGTVEKFKARLVIQGFKQKSGIDYFDTYAPVARISTIRLLIALASIHSLIIHQMNVKTAFLNGELEEEVYMNQPLGFILHGNENKVCKLVKSLYGLKQAPKQWHQKFDEVVLSNGYFFNQADNCVYSKFDASVDLTKEFLSSRFFMKDMGEADVILVSTPLDTCEKLMPNRGLVVSQLEYSRVIGCLMYAMTCTRPDIAFAVGKLSRYTSNPGTQHWQAIQRVLKYVKKTMDYRLVYYGYPSVLEGYTDASWISNTKDNSSTSGWSEFVALAAAGKEAEWLKNLLLEIPLWVKPMAPISILYDSAATLAKAYSQMYNGKSRHLGVRHSMIRELIMNGVISIEFVRSQQNLADHLTKGLARDLVLKSAKGMGLKSNQVTEC